MKVTATVRVVIEHADGGATEVAETVVDRCGDNPRFTRAESERVVRIATTAALDRIGAEPMSINERLAIDPDLEVDPPSWKQVDRWMYGVSAEEVIGAVACTWCGADIDEQCDPRNRTVPEIPHAQRWRDWWNATRDGGSAIPVYSAPWLEQVTR